MKTIPLIRRPRKWPRTVLLVGMASLLIIPTKPLKGASAMTMPGTHEPVALSPEHLAAVQRTRRIMVNNDIGYPLQSFSVTPDQWVAARFSLFDEPGSQVDCISWCIDEGNYACYPSQVLPEVRYPGLQKWLEAGVDIVRVMCEETHLRGKEAFFEYRLNGADRTEDIQTPAQLPLKQQHPDWLLPESWWGPGLWNFAVPEVRAYKVAILREVAENYDYDGLSVDFGRHPPVLPVGQQWEHRAALTDFVRSLRRMLQEVATRRGRPFLLAVRVGESPAGCHYDGLDIETWVQENLIDLLIMGVRSTELDVAGFRRIVGNQPIKLYPSIDDAHSTDGYHHAPLEFFRGLASNWWRQGVDGILTFNFCNESPEGAALLGTQPFAPHRQAYHEIGNPEILRFKDKMFVLQRRYGAGWGELPSGWGTLPDATRHLWDFYQNMNSQAPLPTLLPSEGAPLIEDLYVGDDVSGNAERVEKVELRVLFSGAQAEDGIDAKLNGVLLDAPTVQADGWRIFPLRPSQFAVGENLVSLRWGKRSSETEHRITVEKVEVHVDYRP